MLGARCVSERIAPFPAIREPLRCPNRFLVIVSYSSSQLHYASYYGGVDTATRLSERSAEAREQSHAKE
jgi:hypothetical protein